MSRINIKLPETFAFQCSIPVRITDINYGNHVGNDKILALVHEARMQYFSKLGYTELSFGGTGLIMADAGVIFRQELFYGDTVIVSVSSMDISRIGFDLMYKLEKLKDGILVTAAVAKTGMICYDYEKKKISSLSEDVVAKLKN